MSSLTLLSPGLDFTPATAVEPCQAVRQIAAGDSPNSMATLRVAQKMGRSPLVAATGQLDRAEQYAFDYGRTYDSYLVTERGWEYFWSRGGGGAVAFVRRSKHLFSSGGLLAPDDHKQELLAQFVEHADARSQVLVFLNMAASDLPRLAGFGFQATKWGEEAVIDLPRCDWSGGDYQWVRRQSNFCRRQGLAVSECRRESLPPDQWDKIVAAVSQVSGLFLAGKPQTAEMQLLQARFDVRRLGRKRLFVARAGQGAGRIEGFLACNPCDAGRTWVMETYRQRPDAVRGTVPFLMHQAMRQLRSEGVERVSLCLIPGLRCEKRLPGDSRLVRCGLALGTRYFNCLFETAGAYHFKSRFRPRFEDRYVCVRPQMSLGTAMAFVNLLGVLKLDFRKLCHLAIERWRKRAARSTLCRTKDEG
jgi:phosphatidylglycerol lysyltransferase